MQEKSSFSWLAQSSWPQEKEDVPKRTYSGKAQTRSYPDAKLLKVANLHDSSVNLSQSRIETEAELNHHGDVRTSHAINQSNSKYFGVWTIPLQTFENFEGGIVDTLKKTRFLLAWTMSKLVDIYKRQVKDRLIGPNNV